MKRTAWRIVKEKHAGTAFSGEGARLYGGRWNSPGVAVVYTSATRSLAALETLVHLNPPVLFRFVAIPVEFEDSMVEKLSALPPAWRDEPPCPITQRTGDQWARSGRSAVLEVPSILVPEEANYVINPQHPDFARMRIGTPVPFSFDPRLL